MGSWPVTPSELVLGAPAGQAEQAWAAGPGGIEEEFLGASSGAPGPVTEGANHRPASCSAGYSAGPGMGLGLTPSTRARLGTFYLRPQPGCPYSSAALRDSCQCAVMAGEIQCPLRTKGSPNSHAWWGSRPSLLSHSLSDKDEVWLTGTPTLPWTVHSPSHWLIFRRYSSCQLKPGTCPRSWPRPQCLGQ